MPTTYYIGQPLPGQGTGRIYDYNEEGPQGEGYGQLPAPFTNYVIYNGLMMNTRNSSDIIPLGPEGTNYMNVFESGSGTITRQISMAGLNQGRSPNTVYGVAGSVSFIGSDGTRETLDIPLATLAPKGMRLVWQETSDGGLVITSVPAGQTLAQLNAALDVYRGWVNAQDALEYAVGGYLIGLGKSKRDENRGIFQSVLDAARELVDNPDASTYELINAFIVDNSASFQAVAMLRVLGR